MRPLPVPDGGLEYVMLMYWGEVAKLSINKELDGIEEYKRIHRQPIRLPDDERDYPDLEMIRKGKEVRGIYVAKGRRKKR